MSNSIPNLMTLLHEEANRATFPPELGDRVLRRARRRRLVTGAIGGIAVVAILVSGSVALDRVRSGSAIAPAQPGNTQGVKASLFEFEVPYLSAEFGRPWMVGSWLENVAAGDDSVVFQDSENLYVLDSESNAFEVEVTGIPGKSLGSMAVGFNAIWTAGWLGDLDPESDAAATGLVTRIDLADVERLATDGHISFEDVGQEIWAPGRGHAPDEIAIGTDSVWVIESLGDRVLRFSPKGDLLDEIPVGHTPTGIASGEGAIWVTHAPSDPMHYGKGDSTLLKIDPLSGAATEAVSAGECPMSVITGASAVWVLDCSQVVRQFDPVTMREIGSVELPHAAADLVVAEGYLWTLHPDELVVLRTDLETLRQIGEPIRLEGSEGKDWWAASIDYGAGSIWAIVDQAFRLDLE